MTNISVKTVFLRKKIVHMTEKNKWQCSVHMASNPMSQFVSRVEFHVLHVTSIFFITNIMHTSSLLNMSVRTSCTSIHHLVRHYEDSNNWCLLSNSFANHFGTHFLFSFFTHPLKIVKSVLQLTFRRRKLITSRISLLANYFSS